MPSLIDIPLETLIDNILPYLPLKDILSLTIVSKDFAVLCSDDTFWKRKLKEDYNFSDVASARTKGYKFLYKGVHKARVYVWGAHGGGRLGLGKPKHRGGILNSGIPYPKHLNIPGPRIVDLAASGWAFHAIDSEGSIHVWGQLDGEGNSLDMDPYYEACKKANIPVKLELPEKITNVSCGRKHATALSANNRVWIFVNWGSPYVLTSDFLSTTHELTTPIQVESGWTFSAALTGGGDVYVWWPLDDELFGRLNVDRYDYLTTINDRPVEKDGVVKCFPWEVSANPTLLPPLRTQLPPLRGKDHPVGDKIVKIAAGDRFIIALSKGGHILKMDFPQDAESFRANLNIPKWEYLYLFSERDHIVNHETFRDTAEQLGLIRITHISAHFTTFFAFSTGSNSIVLQGTRTTGASDSPMIKPSLQHRDIIAVVQGDYHFGALTSGGKLLTWGKYSSGAMGLGDPTRLPVGSSGGYVSDRERVAAQRSHIEPPEVREPTEVQFDTKGDKPGRSTFVFKATAAGWHMGALVIDLEDGEGVDTETDEEEESRPERSPWSNPPFYGHMPFRVGLAGARGRRGGH